MMPRIIDIVFVTSLIFSEFILKNWAEFVTFFALLLVSFNNLSFFLIALRKDYSFTRLLTAALYWFFLFFRQIFWASLQDGKTLIVNKINS